MNSNANFKVHETFTEVRYGETDQMGYAHHSVAVSWFELGRVVWMRDNGLAYGDMEKRDLLMPVAKLVLNYRAPGRFEDKLAIQTKLVELGRSRVAFENKVCRLDKQNPAGRLLLVEGRVDLACVDRTGKIQRLPEDVRALMEKLVTPLEAPPSA